MITVECQARQCDDVRDGFDVVLDLKFAVLLLSKTLAII